MRRELFEEIELLDYQIEIVNECILDVLFNL